MLDAEVVDDVAALGPVVASWDALAVANRLPMSAPAWTLAWWRHLAPAGAHLRVVLVRDGSELVGVAPYFAERAVLGRCDYRLIGSGIYHRIAPLALPGREWEVAERVAAVLAAARPRPDLITLEGVALATPWRTLLREHWPGPLRARRYDTSVQSAPVVRLDAPSFEAWLSGQSSNFRSQMRRSRRRFEDEHGRARLATAETLEADVKTFGRLHAGRWEGRGSSSIVRMGRPLLDALVEGGVQHLADGRFRLWTLEMDGEAISSQMFVAAGGEVAYWNGGWDERFAQLKPPMLAILYAVEDAFRRGDDRIDLGGGALHYKLRFANGTDAISWGGVYTPGVRSPLARMTLAPTHARVAARGALRRTLSEEQLGRLKSLRGRRAGR